MSGDANDDDREELVRKIRSAFEAFEREARRSPASDKTLAMVKRLLGGDSLGAPRDFDRSMIESLLRHEDWKRRFAGLVVVGMYWKGDRDFAGQALHISVTDDHEQVRGMGLHTLGRLLKGSRDRKAGRHLARLVLDLSLPVKMRAAAYLGLCILHGVDIPLALEVSEFIREVDDAVVRYYTEGEVE